MAFKPDGVCLMRTSYEFPPNRRWRVWPAYLGASNVLLQVRFDVPATLQQVARATWTHQIASYRLASGSTARVWLSRVTPAALFESQSRAMTLTAPREDAGLEYFAWSTRTGIVVRSASELGAVQPVSLSEPWLLAWFGKRTPHRGYSGIIDLDDEHEGAGFARKPHPGEPLDVPVLLRFEQSPRELRLTPGSVTIGFDRPFGKIACLPVLGGRVCLPADTEAWRDGMPEDVVRLCRRWAEFLTDVPVSVSETFRVQQDQGTVSIHQEFRWISFRDAWGTSSTYAAPVPPLLAVALGGKVPVRFTVAGEVRTPVALDVMDTAGQAMFLLQAREYTYHVSGLGDYLAPLARRAKAELPDSSQHWQRKLEAHVRQMVNAGHLQPLFYVYGGIGGPRPAFFYWAGFPELAEALDAAYPWLSEPLQREVKAYLAREFKFNPPWQVDLRRYMQGAPRAPYPFPWEDVGRQRFVAERRERVVRAARAFGDWYGVERFISLTDHPVSQTAWRARADEMLTELLAQQDWALMGPVKPHGPLADSFTGAGYYERNGQATMNSRLAGAIGLARLAHRWGWTEEEQWAWYVFAKLAMARVGAARYTMALHEHGVVRGPVEADWRTLVHIDPVCAIVLRGNPKPVVFEDQELPPFINLVPETGLILARHAREPCRIYLDHLDRSMPLWYLNEAPKQSASEQRLCPLQHHSGNVTAQYWILGKRGEAFLRYVDATRFVGDLYYIRNLATALESMQPEK